MDEFPQGFDPQDPTEVIGGRRFPYHTAGDWVYLAVDPQTGKRIPQGAKAMYSTLRMHVNHGRNDSVVWPGTDALAEIAGLSRGDKVKPHIDPLVRIGAVEVHVIRWGDRKQYARNFYVVHEAPPQGYTGWLSLADFYAERKKLHKEMEETGQRLGYVTKPGAPEKRVPRLTSENTASPLGPPKTGGPDTPKRGDQPQQPPELKTTGEEEAALAREDQSPEPENAPTPEPAPLPEPSLFALATLRSTIEIAPQTTGDHGGLPETIGESEIKDLARAFDAEVRRLVDAGVRQDQAGSQLMAWVGRGLGSADSLYAVLSHRLRPGYATSKLTTPRKTPKAPQGPPEPRKAPQVADVWTCPDHEGATPGHCPECERIQNRLREQRAKAARSGAGAARAALAGQG